MIPTNWEIDFWVSQSNFATTGFSATADKLKQIKFMKAVGRNPNEAAVPNLQKPLHNKPHNWRYKAKINHDEPKEVNN